MIWPTDIYRFGHGGGWAGQAAPVVRAAWRNAMAKDTWAQIPGNTLASINPENDPAINPNGAGVAAPWRGYEGQAAIVADWCGMSLNDATGDLLLGPGGGHQGYSGNERYKNSTNVNAPAWAMIHKPSGAIGMAAVNLNDTTQTTTGLWQDGEPRSGHTYNNVEHIPGLGLLQFFIYGCSPGNPLATSKKIFLFDETTGASTLWIDDSVTSLIDDSRWGSATGGIAYDPSRNCVWRLGIGTASLIKLDLATKQPTAVTYPDNIAAGYARLRYLPQYDMLAVFHNGGAGYKAPFSLYDLANNYTIIEPGLTGAWSAGLDTSNNYGQLGCDWDGGAFTLWHNTANTEQLSILTPPANPRATGATWAKSVRMPASSNTVIPTVRCVNGTFSRFRRSALMGGYYLLNAYDQPVYFYATE